MSDSPRDFTELGRLIALACDGRIEANEQAELERMLASDPEARQFYLRYIALDVELAWMLGDAPAAPSPIAAGGSNLLGPAAEAPSPAAIVSPARPTGAKAARAPARKRSWLLVASSALGAAAIAAVVALAMFAKSGTQPQPDPEIAAGPGLESPTVVPPPIAVPAPLLRVVELEGEAWAEADGRPRRQIAVGESLQLGESIQSREDDGQVELALADDSRLRLLAGTKLTIPLQPAPGVQLKLDRGVVHCQVRPRPAYAPLVIAAPLASVRVVGTRFTLSAAPDSFTRLDMDEGQVELTCLASRQKLLVGAGYYCVVSAREIPLAAVKYPALVTLAKAEWPKEYAAALTFLPTGDGMLAASRTRVASWRWATDDRKLLKETPTEARLAPVFSSDGSLVASPAAGGKWELHQASDWTPRGELGDFTQGAVALAVAARGERVAVVKANEAGGYHLEVYARDGAKLESRPLGELPVLVWSPPGDQLFVGLAGAEPSQVLEFGAKGLRWIPMRTSRGVRAAAFSIDGRFLTTAQTGPNKIVVWDAGSGSPRNNIETHTAIGSLAFTPDSLWVCAALADGHLRFWRALTGDESATISLDGRRAAAMAFSGSGKQLAVSLPGKGVRLYELSGLLRAPGDNTPSPSDTPKTTPPPAK